MCMFIYIYIYVYVYEYVCIYVFMYICFCIYHSQKSKIGLKYLVIGMIYETQAVGEKKKKGKKLSYLPLPTATLKKLRPTFSHCRIPQFVSSTANLYIICKTFILSYPSINKSKYKLHQDLI